MQMPSNNSRSNIKSSIVFYKKKYISRVKMKEDEQKNKKQKDMAAEIMDNKTAHDELQALRKYEKELVRHFTQMIKRAGFATSPP